VFRSGRDREFGFAEDDGGGQLRGLEACSCVGGRLNLPNDPMTPRGAVVDSSYFAKLWQEAAEILARVDIASVKNVGVHAHSLSP